MPEEDMPEEDIMDRLNLLHTYLDEEKSKNHELREKYDTAVSNGRELEELIVEVEEEKKDLSQEIARLKEKNKEISEKVDVMLEHLNRWHDNQTRNEGKGGEGEEASDSDE